MTAKTDWVDGDSVTAALLNAIGVAANAIGLNNVVEDTTPQLGGNLDPQSFTVGAATAADLTKLHAVTADATELSYTDGVTSAIQTQLNAKQPLDASINAQTGTTYTFVVADDGKVVTASNASAQTYTVPQNSAQAIPVGAYIEVIQLGAGQVTFVAGSGATLNSRGGALKINAQYGVAGLRKTATNTFVLAGDVTT